MDSAQGIAALLAVAERFEQIGAEFYRQAAQRVDNPEVRRELERLAEMEVAHDRAFSQMKAQYTGQPIAVGREEAIADQLKTCRDNRVFGSDLDLDRKMGELVTLSEVIEFAIALEKNSIVFYVGLSGLVADKAFNEVLQKIIQEELSHLAALVDLPVY